MLLCLHNYNNGNNCSYYTHTNNLDIKTPYMLTRQQKGKEKIHIFLLQVLGPGVSRPFAAHRRLRPTPGSPWPRGRECRERRALLSRRRPRGQAAASRPRAPAVTMQIFCVSFDL